MSIAPTRFKQKGEARTITFDFGTKLNEGDSVLAVVGGALAVIDTVQIVSNTIANPTVVTTAAPHGLETGESVVISGVITSNPTINGTQVVTVTGLTTFTVPVNVTIAGTGGSLRSLIVSAPSLVLNKVSARISVGTVSSMPYRISCRVTTTQGETLELDVNIRVADGVN